MKEATNTKKSSTKGYEEVFKACLKTVLPSLTDESFTLYMEKREEGLPAILLLLIEDYGGNNFQGRDSLGKIISEIGAKMLTDTQFKEWVGHSIRPVWMVSYFASSESLQFQDVVKMLKCVQTQKPDCEDIPKFLLHIGQECDIENFQDQKYNNILSDKMKYNKVWKSLISKIPVKPNEHTIDIEGFSIKIEADELAEVKEVEKDYRELDDQMKKDLRIMIESELDKLIQDDLIKAFESEFLKGAFYGDKNYYELVKKVEKKAKQFDVYSSGLRIQLEEHPEKNKFYNKILMIRNKIHQVFVPQLMNLMNTSKRARGAIEGKDTIVLLGSSGAGKTTTIQMLLGYTLKKGKDINGIDTLLSTTKLSNEHKEFVAKASSKSVTKYVTAIQMNLKKYDYDEPIYLVDTPGFFDTKGLVVDACNSLSTIDVLGTANSIRFGFVFNYKSWGKRADAFKDFVKIISRIFSSYQKNKSKVLYLLNEFSREDLEGFPARIREFRRNGLNQYEKGDRKLLDVVDHIISLLEKAQRSVKRSKSHLSEGIFHSEQLAMIDPLSPDLESIYTKLLDSERKIMNPKKQLDSAISEEVRQVLNGEVNQLQSIINSCIKLKKTSALKYYFGCLEKIAEITKEVGDCAQAGDRLKKIIEKTKNEYNAKIEVFQISLNRILNLRTDDDLFSQYKEEKRQLEEMEQTYRTLPGLENFSRTQQINQIIKEIEIKLIKKTQQSITQDLYDTISLFSKYFNPNFFQSFSRQRKKKENFFIKEIGDLITNNQFTKFDQKYKELTEICKFTGDMDEEYNTLNLKSQACKKIEQTKQNYENFLASKAESTLILQASEIEFINKTLEIYSIESTEIPQIKEAFSTMKMETYKFFTTHITKITAFIKNNREIANPLDQNTVFTSITNAKELTKVKEIQGQAKINFDYLQAEIMSQISSRKKSLDENIAKEKIDQLRNIYREIKQIEKLNSLCQPQEKKENILKINSSKRLLKGRIQGIQQEETSNPYTLENSAIQYNTERLVNSYKICFSIKQEYINNLKKKLGNYPEEFDPTQVQGRDQVVIICERVLEKVRENLEKIVGQIKLFIEQTMQKINKLEALNQIHPGIITKYIRIKKFFDTITNTDFNPPTINIEILRVRQLFQKSFRENFRSFENHVIEMLDQIIKAIWNNQINNQLLRNVDYITKLKKIRDKVAKSEIMKGYLNTSAIDSMENEDYQDFQESDRIPNTISLISTRIKESFDVNNKNLTFQKCYDLINLCKGLEGLDSIFSHERKFFNLSKELMDQMSASSQSMKRSYDKVLEMNSLANLQMFKQAYDYYSKFPPKTPQNQMLNDMISHLKGIFEGQETCLIHNIKQIQRIVKQTSRSPIDEKKIQDIFTKITEIYDAIKKLNRIIKADKEKYQIEFNQNSDTLKQIGETFFKIIESQIEKVQKFIEGGDYQSPEIFIQRISTFEEMIDEFKIKNEAYQQKLLQSDKSRTIAQRLKAEIQTRKNKRDSKFNGKEIVVDTNFSEQILALDQSKRRIVRDKLKISYNNRLTELEKKHEKQLSALLEALNNLKDQPQFSYLSYDIKKEIEIEINSRIKKTEEKYNEEMSEVDSKFKLSESAELIKKEQRSYVLKAYESKTKQEFDKILQDIGNSKTSKDIINIFSSILQLFKEKDLQNNLNFTKIYDQFCERVYKTLQEFAFKRTSSLKKILSYQSGALPRQTEIQGFVSEIKEIYIFFDNNRSKIKGSDPKKCLQQLSKVLLVFVEELKQKSQFKFQDVLKNQFRTAFTCWFFEYQHLTFVAEELNDMEERPELENCYNQLSLELEPLKEKEREILQYVSYIEDEVKKTKIYSESLKNISDLERKQRLANISEKINSLKNLEKFGVIGKNFFKKNFNQVTQQLDEGIREQIVEALMKNCQDVNLGFQDLKNQFKQEINVSLDLITSQNKFFDHLKVQKSHKTKLIDTIEQNYTTLEQKCSSALQKLREMKVKQEKNEKQFSTLKHQKNLEMAENCKLKQQRMLIEQNKKLEDRLRNVTNQQEIKSIQKANQSETKLLKQQIWEVLGEENQKIGSEEIQKQIRQAELESEVMAQYCDFISLYYKGVLEISWKQNYYKEKIDKFLAEYKRILGKKKFKLLFEIFRTRNNNYASILIYSFEIFKNNQALQIYAKIKGFDREYVLKQLSLKDQTKHSLRLLHESYESQFRNWTKEYQRNTSEATINQLLECIEQSARNCKQFYDNELKIEEFKPAILISQILVLWTILKSQIKQEQVQFDFQPHPAQVITIFLCLSLTSEQYPRDLNSKMAQVGTGEGKSLILAGLSSYLALCGFEVSCVCYSEYLSARDYNQYQGLFQKLKINKKVMYGTFNTVCQSLLNKDSQQETKFSEEIKKILQSPSQGFSSLFWSKITSYFKKLLPQSFIYKEKTKNKRIMLVDEVDVFFNRDFFGQVYRPEVCIFSPEIKSLIQFVWRKYKQNPELTDSTIKQSQEFKNAVQKFKKLQNLLKDQVKGMILGCRNCNHNYIVRDELIQYPDQDGYSSKLNYGFSTLFAYLKEHDYNRIALIQKAIKMSFIIAEFSYAMLPTYFRSMIGVTGTYSQMPASQKNYMRDQYKVQEVYSMPSVYGSVSKRINKKPKIVDPEIHMKTVIEEILSVHLTGRPVLVFFQTNKQLENFYNSEAYQELQNKTAILNETHKPEERDPRIKKTCRKCQITFMTKAFGRGTDFIIIDESILKIGEGGLHVIQTFISTENSEEIQIQGRTARNGDPGTYILIAKKTDLERLQMEPQSIRNFQSQVKQARKQKYRKQNQQQNKLLKISKAKHEECIKIYLDQNIKQQTIIEYIEKLNKYEIIRNKSCKTSIFVDGTKSMKKTIAKLRGILEEVMKDISQIIGKYPHAKQSLIQLGFYRNYNCPINEIFQTTAFENRPQNLLEAWKKVKGQGGMGHEAIEVAFHYLNSNPDINQVIIIGDAQENSEVETVNNRKKCTFGKLVGEEYWSKHLPILSAQAELQKIIERKLPIHCFYIKADEYFQRVSKRTGGVAQKFEIDQLDASKKLSKFIADRILEQVAQNERQAKEMKTSYVEKEKRRYSSF